MSYLHVFDIFPLKIAGSRYITNAIRTYFPLARSKEAYLEAIGLEDRKRCNHYRSSMEITVSRGQEILLEEVLKRCQPHSWLGFWVKRCFGIKARRKRWSETEWPKGMSALHFAAFYGSEAIAASHIKQRERIDSRTRNGMTPLHIAAWKGHAKVASLLLRAGASISARDDCGCTALSLAAQCGHEETVHMLLQSLRTTIFRFRAQAYKRAALAIAKKYNNPDCVRVIESEI